jgi:hypothetical protein
MIRAPVPYPIFFDAVSMDLLDQVERRCSDDVLLACLKTQLAERRRLRLDDEQR